MMKIEVVVCAALLTCAFSAEGARQVTIPGTQPYTDTGIDLAEGQPLRITASGEIEVAPWSYWGRDGFDWRVGPLGTYNYKKAVEDKRFPLPAAQRGPAPCYCLIGKIGEDGKPFFVGEEYHGTASSSGKLYLGINDFDCADNAGSFSAEIAVGEGATAPPGKRDDIVIRAADLPGGKPVPEANVVLIYVDGLRYDVLREMVEAGHLPLIKEIFFDGGTDFVNAYSGFPSSTLASNGTMYTGVFPNRSGIKGNNFFDRKRLKGDTYLEPFGPPIAADHQRPAGLRALGLAIKKGFLWPFRSASRRCAQARENDIPLLQDYLKARGMRYCTTIQPVLPQSPPDRYEVDASTVIPPLYFHHALDYMDQINSRFVQDLVIQPDARVMNYWFPNVDTMCHESARAQFGNARKAVYLLDRWIGAMVTELKRKKMWDRTYMILFADHGTAGGKSGVLQKVDVGREFFYTSTPSGLGWNVRWYDDGYRRKGMNKKSFAFVDYGEGECRIFLPYARIDSGEWLKRNNLYTLAHYSAAPAEGEVNLIEKLLAWDLGDQNLYPEKVSGRPVGQVLVKIDDHRVAVYGQGGTEAIIERTPEGAHRSRLRYIPVKNVSPSSDGNVTYEESPDADPFGYIAAGIPLEWLRESHNEREWLERTKQLKYPDAVVAAANCMFWDGIMASREGRYSPDMVLCAASGWSFEAPEKLSGNHGYLTYESMHIPLLITGPNVRRGIMVSDAVRTADLVPTVLSLLGVPFGEAAFDGRPLAGFLKAEGEEPTSGESAKALLAKLPYAAEAVDVEDALAEYEKRKGEKNPEFLVPDTRYEGHDYERGTDIHNVAADLLGVFNREAFTDLDNLFDLAWPGDKKQPFDSAFDAIVKGYDKLPDHYPKERIRELVFALQIREFTLGEAPPVIFLSVTGLAGRGVIFRCQLLLKWMEDMFSDMDYAMLYPLREKKIRVVSNVNYLLGGVRISLEKLSWGLIHYVGKALYDGIYHIEKFNEKTVRAVKGQTPA
jgi:arylsulfatase A-like enzyme